MENRNFFIPIKGKERKTSPAERRDLDKDIREVLGRETPEELYEKIQADMDFLLNKYFPNEFSSYRRWNKPSFSYILQSFQFSKIRLGREINDQALKPNQESSVISKKEMPGFIAAALIRYIDDFIDEQLWPKLHEYSEEYIRKEFHSFIIEALMFVRRFDPEMPDSIARLVRLEIDLELEPTQENFDYKCVDLLRQKSYDMFYVSSLLGLIPRRDFSQLSLQEEIEYEAIACADYARDFSDDKIDKDTDLNLARLIIKNELDPSVLITYLCGLESCWEEENPDPENYQSLNKIVDLRYKLEKLRD